MTQTMDLPKLRTFDLLSPSEQAAIRRHCQNVVALALRRKYGTVAEHVPDPDVAHMPEPTPRKFTRSQLESGFANYPEPKAKPGPQPERKTNHNGERRTWTRGGKQSSRKGQRQRPDKPVAIVAPKPAVVEVSKLQQIRNIIAEHGPITNAQIAERLGWRDANAAKSVSVRTSQLLMRGEIIKHAEFKSPSGFTVHVYATPGTPPDAAYSKETPRTAAQIEPKIRPVLDRPSRPREATASPQRAPALPERIRNLLTVEKLTNAEIAERLNLPANRDTMTRVSTLTSRMHQRKELIIVGQHKKKGSPLANIYAAGPVKPGRQFEKTNVVPRTMEWLKSEGIKTKDQIAAYLGENEDYRSVISRLLRYGMAHVAGQTTSAITGRPLKLYAAGPEPRGKQHEQ